MKAWIFVGAILIAITTGRPIPAQASAHWKGCAPQGPMSLARRTGSDSCWVAFEARDPDTGVFRICIPKMHWNSWLHSPTPALCGDWEGKWTAYSPPANSLYRFQNRKSILMLFRVSQLPKVEKASLVDRIRQAIERLREQTHAWLAPLDSTGTLTHLVTGTKKPGSQLDLFLLLGFVHVLSASGIHLYALARLWNGIFKKLIPFTGVSVQTALFFSRALTSITWALAWLLAGARIGMLRPWLVVVLRLGGRRLGLRWRKWAPLGLAMATDLSVGAWRGDLLSNTGRWIYAFAVGGGLMARSSLGMAIGSWVFAAFGQAWWDGTVSVATPLLSLVTVTLYSVLIYPSVLLALAFKALGLSALAETIAIPAGLGSQWLMENLNTLVQSLSLFFTLPRFSLLAGAMLAAWLMRCRVRTALTVAFAILVFRWGVVQLHEGKPATAAAQVEQLDVGQGDAALVWTRARDRSWSFGMIDAGSERALSESAWLKLLASRGAHRLDWVALTHLDEDHSGGLIRLAQIVPIRCVATSQEEIRSSRAQRLRQSLAAYGIRFSSWEDSACVPYPVFKPIKTHKGKANGNMSAVLIPLEKGGFYLSSGDADREDERRMIEWAIQQTRTWAPGLNRILKVGHHGSRTSSDPDFIQKLRPTEAWISAGVGNRYGHPSVETLQTLKGQGIPIRRTDEQGVIQN